MQFDKTRVHALMLMVAVCATACGGGGGSDDPTAAETDEARRDRTPPTLTVTAPTAEATLATAQGSVTVAGTANDNVQVSRVAWRNDRGGSGDATLQGTGMAVTWSAGPIALAQGSNVLTLQAYDRAGQMATKTLTVTYDTTAPPPPPPPGGGPRLGGVPSAPPAISATVGQTVIRSVVLSNTGGAALTINATGGDNASGLAPRSATVAPGASLTLRSAIACDRAGTRQVAYALQTNDPSATNATLTFDTTCSAPSVSYAGPITITRGGTYSGNWESTDAAVAAVSIRTTEPVVIENCRVRGPGNLIASRFSDSDGFAGVDLTIRNCVGTGTGGIDAERGRGHFYIGVWPKRVVIENNAFESTTGIWIVGDQQAGAVQALRVTGNRVRNVTGRANAVGLIEINATPSLEVSWNEVINEPFAGFQEDVILTYKVQGSAADPARVHSNFIDGAYPRNPRTDPSTGSGINAGDGDASAGNRFVHAHDNHVVRAVNVGMFIAAGSDNLLYGNRILSSGLLPDGTLIDHRFTGMYVWDCCYGQVPSGIFRNNVARDNWVGYESVEANGIVTRLADKLDDCARDAGGASLCTGNMAPAGRVTSAMEDAERQRWLDRVAARGLGLGPR